MNVYDIANASSNTFSYAVATYTTIFTSIKDIATKTSTTTFIIIGTITTVTTDFNNDDTLSKLFHKFVRNENCLNTFVI